MTIDHRSEGLCEMTRLTHGFEAERRGRPLRLGSDSKILCADGKKAFGLDPEQLISATALVRFWSLALLAYAFLDEERDCLQKPWQRPVTLGETRREIQRLHRRPFLPWLCQQFRLGATDESLFELLAASREELGKSANLPFAER